MTTTEKVYPNLPGVLPILMEKLIEAKLDPAYSPSTPRRITFYRDRDDGNNNGKYPEVVCQVRLRLPENPLPEDEKQERIDRILVEAGSNYSFPRRAVLRSQKTGELNLERVVQLVREAYENADRERSHLLIRKDVTKLNEDRLRAALKKSKLDKLVEVKVPLYFQRGNSDYAIGNVNLVTIRRTSDPLDADKDVSFKIHVTISDQRDLSAVAPMLKALEKSWRKIVKTNAKPRDKSGDPSPRRK